MFLQTGQGRWSGWIGYQNMLVCDGAAMPANPGVNPALTITAVAEYAMTQIPVVGPEPF
ncbi:MAG: hypothetical protein NVS3B11_15050 [Collimonas sp.]